MKTSSILFVGFMIFSVSYGQEASVNNVNSNEFSELISANKGVLIDVRTTSEFKNGHMGWKNSKNFFEDLLRAAMGRYIILHRE